MKDYADFLNAKAHMGADHGFDPLFMPDMLFDFQKHLVEWATRKGRSAIFADCGLGKTLMQLTWAQNVIQKTNGRVLILTPLAVAFQTEKEAHKIGIDCAHRKEGIISTDKMVVTNYERLHHFNPEDFQGVVCDESSILKNYDGKIKDAITDFMRKRPYRLLCTATAAPNDYIELGTSSEALGEMGAHDMLSKFFKKTDKTYSRKHEHMSGLYRFRGHAERDFWRWVCSWARACRKPSDLGFDNQNFALPNLIQREHVVQAKQMAEGFLFELPAVSLQEQRSELRRSIEERCEMASTLLNRHDKPAVAWCHLNDEGKMLESMISGAVEVSGADSDDKKEEAFRGFADGSIRVLVSKPSIAGFGLNWQHCAHMSFFPSHSYEQFYQSVRRCWRFGQKNPVTVDVISTEGQRRVFENLRRKSEAAEKMFGQLVELMQNELKIVKVNKCTKKESVPSWL